MAFDELGGEAFELSWAGVEPRVVRAVGLVAGFSEARLGRCARVLVRSFTGSRAIVALLDEAVAGCLVAVGAVDEEDLLGALAFAALTVDWRLVIVFGPVAPDGAAGLASSFFAGSVSVGGVTTSAEAAGFSLPFSRAAVTAEGFSGWPKFVIWSSTPF